MTTRSSARHVGAIPGLPQRFGWTLVISCHWQTQGCSLGTTDQFALASSVLNGATDPRMVDLPQDVTDDQLVALVSGKLGELAFACIERPAVHIEGPTIVKALEIDWAGMTVQRHRDDVVVGMTVTGIVDGDTVKIRPACDESGPHLRGHIHIVLRRVAIDLFDVSPTKAPGITASAFGTAQREEARA